jgi:hypothetical protein
MTVAVNILDTIEGKILRGVEVLTRDAGEAFVENIDHVAIRPASIVLGNNQRQLSRMTQIGELKRAKLAGIVVIGLISGASNVKHELPNGIVRFGVQDLSLLHRPIGGRQIRIRGSSLRECE